MNFAALTQAARSRRRIAASQLSRTSRSASWRSLALTSAIAAGDIEPAQRTLLPSIQ